MFILIHEVTESRLLGYGPGGGACGLGVRSAYMGFLYPSIARCMASIGVSDYLRMLPRDRVARRGASMEYQHA